MDPQLEELASILVRQGLRAWVDTGTLLGLVRDGGLIPHDGDIDLSIWDRDLPGLADVAATLVALGHREEIWTLDGAVFKWKFHPGARRGPRVVDFKVYRRRRDHAWSPQAYEREPRWWPNWIVVRTLRRTLLRATRRRRIDHLPWRAFYGANTWWVPARHFEDLVPGPRAGLWSPAEQERYLELHYGDWRRPVEDWTSTTNDGAVVLRHPLECGDPS